MFKYEYGKRIKSMVNREINLELRENSLSKLSSKYHAKLENLELKYAEQRRRFYQIKKRMQEQRQNNEQFEKMLEDVRARMLEAEAAVQKRVAETVENRLQLIKQLDEIHTLKIVTNTYINLNALPTRIQGVSVKYAEDGSSWRPFCVEPLGQTPKELQQLIWGNSENAADYSEAWERLVFRTVREMLQQLTERS